MIYCSPLLLLSAAWSRRSSLCDPCGYAPSALENRLRSRAKLLAFDRIGVGVDGSPSTAVRCGCSTNDYFDRFAYAPKHVYQRVDREFTGLLVHHV